MNISFMCSPQDNKTCWRTSVEELNSLYARLMVPVEVMMALFMVVGVPGNALVLLVYIFKQNKTSAHILIMHLAAIDLCACSVIHPYIIYKLLNFYDQTWVGACKVFEFLVHLNLCASGITLLVVAIDRYLAICKPVKYLRFDTLVAKMIGCTMAVAVSVSMPLLEFYGTRSGVKTHHSVTVITYRCDYSDAYQGTAAMMGFSALVMFLFLLEVVIMSVLYKNVAQTAYRTRRTVVPLSNAHILAGIKPSCSSSDTTMSVKTTRTVTSTVQMSQDSQLDTAEDRPQRHGSLAFRQPRDSHHVIKTLSSRDVMFCVETHFGSNETSLNRYRPNISGLTDKNAFNSRLKAAKILFLVTAVYFLSWMPFFIMRICHTIDNTYWVQTTDMERVLDNLLNHFFYINNAANPIIYTIINKNFRVECKQVLRKQFRCCV